MGKVKHLCRYPQFLWLTMITAAHSRLLKPFYLFYHTELDHMGKCDCSKQSRQ